MIVQLLATIHPLSLAAYFFVLGFGVCGLARAVVEYVRDRRAQARRAADFLRINGGRRG